MALSSFLLAGGSKKVDKELDNLFKSTKTLDAAPTSISAKRTPTSDVNFASGSVGAGAAHSSVSPKTLKRKNSTVEPGVASKRAKGKASEENLKAGKTVKPEIKERKVGENTKATSKSSRRKKDQGHEVLSADEDENMEEVSDEDDEDDNSDLENAYLTRTLKGKGKGKAPAATVPDESEEIEGVADDGSAGSDEEASDTDASPPQHESVSKKRSKEKVKRKQKVKYVPPSETTEQRNARTVFVGNLSVDVAQKKGLLKQLQRHIISLIPLDSPNVKPKIESTRFRSVPFAVPTANLSDDDDDEPTGKSKSKKQKQKSRQHDLDRVSIWKGADNETKEEKNFLTPAQKKKIAFIKQEFHSAADSVNAYIVFAHPHPEDSPSGPKTKTNLPPPPAVMDPYEAARKAKEACEGSLFMERVLRVDVVAKNATAAQAASQGRVLRTDADPKRCVFVGNLDFESREEDVRVFFEGVVAAERGPRVEGEVGGNSESESGSDDEEENGEKGKAGKSQRWVTRVRIIRDKDTQMGKGFAYVQFADRTCVDEILALEPSKLKFAKRKLRVERCKTLPGGTLKSSIKSKSTATKTSASGISKSASTSLSASTSIPKGDPNLGAKLAHLSKDERKQAKAADADRLARRLAKKKARMVLAVGKGSGSEGVKIQGKERNRERKGKGKSGVAGRGQGHGAGSAAKNKGRVKSDRSIAKRNVKK